MLSEIFISVVEGTATEAEVTVTVAYVELRHLKEALEEHPRKQKGTEPLPLDLLALIQFSLFCSRNPYLAIQSADTEQVNNYILM
jgi:hypothetical protein